MWYPVCKGLILVSKSMSYMVNKALILYALKDEYNTQSTMSRVTLGLIVKYLLEINVSVKAPEVKVN